MEEGDLPAKDAGVEGDDKAAHEDGEEQDDELGGVYWIIAGNRYC